jgi:hypothetical protein
MSFLKHLPVSAHEFPISRRICIVRFGLEACALNISSKKSRTPESPRGIRHLAVTYILAYDT